MLDIKVIVTNQTNNITIDRNSFQKNGCNNFLLISNENNVS